MRGGGGNGGFEVVSNYGTIAGTGTADNVGYGVEVGAAFGSSATVTNGSSSATSALITGTKYGLLGLLSYGHPATVITNFGSISGGGAGIRLKGGGQIVNQLGALITGQIGVLSRYAAATITNAGTIVGTGGTALQFGTETGDRLILDPGATFVGAARGGSGGTALEFASGSGGIGTFSGLGSSLFAGFAGVAVDAGSHWVFKRGNTVASGVHMTIASGGAVSLADHAALFAPRGSVLDVNGQLAVSAGSSVFGGSISGSGTIVLDTGANLLAFGRIDTKHLSFASGGAETLRLGVPAAMTATIAGFGATDTIDLLKVVATEKTFAAGTLIVSGTAGEIAALKFAGPYSSANFKLVSDHHGGTDILYVAHSLPSTELLAGLGGLRPAALADTRLAQSQAGGSVDNPAADIANAMIAWHQSGSG